MSRFALRVKDRQAPTRVGFHGLHWYPPNAAYRVHARWIPYNPPKMLDIPTVLGHHDPSSGAGRGRIHSRRTKLSGLSPCSRIRRRPSFSLFFAMPPAKLRRTARDVSFIPICLTMALSQPGEVWLDFNRLENPPCAFTAYATCPMPPPQNRLSVPIPAGEQPVPRLMGRWIGQNRR